MIKPVTLEEDLRVTIAGWERIRQTPMEKEFPHLCLCIDLLLVTLRRVQEEKAWTPTAVSMPAEDGRYWVSIYSPWGNSRWVTQREFRRSMRDFVRKHDELIEAWMKIPGPYVPGREIGVDNEI